MNNTDAQLSAQAKDQIRSYIYKLILPTGIVAAVIGWFFGYSVRTNGENRAYSEAFQNLSGQAQITIRDMTMSTQKQLTDVTEQAAILKSNLKESEILFSEAVKLNNQAKSTSIVKDLVGNSSFKKEVTASLTRSLKWTFVSADDKEDFDPVGCQYKFVIEGDREPGTYYFSRSTKTHLSTWQPSHFFVAYNKKYEMTQTGSTTPVDGKLWKRCTY